MVILWTLNDFFVVFDSTQGNGTVCMTGVTGWCSNVDDECLTLGLSRWVGVDRTDTTDVLRVNG